MISWGVIICTTCQTGVAGESKKKVSGHCATQAVCIHACVRTDLHTIHALPQKQSQRRVLEMENNAIHIIERHRRKDEQSEAKESENQRKVK